MTPRRPIIAANWKMNMTPQESEEFLQPFISKVPDNVPVDIVIAPPFVSIPAAGNHISDSVTVKLAAQNMSQHISGAYTGEVSLLMLKDLSVHYVILGHSERRAIYGEQDEDINAKVLAALEGMIRPILCVGETLEERDADRVESVLTTQVTGGLVNVPANKLSEVVLAYEPVWAIGTGRTASPEQAQQAHAVIRKVIADLYDEDTAAKVRIQYGGSVKPDNMAELISQPDVDGALVGGASLDPDSFFGIVEAAAASVNAD